MNKLIGGYFELELPETFRLHEDIGIGFVNLGRTGLVLIAQARHYRKVWIPDYVCPVVPESLAKAGIGSSVYSINQELEPVSLPVLSDGEGLLYVDYFGVKGAYCRQLEKSIGSRLILDLTQAYYYRPASDIDGFNSARKFFGVPDGGLVFGNQLPWKNLPPSLSWSGCEHLLRRLDCDVSGGYTAFQTNEEAMRQWPCAQMSQLTQRILSSIDVGHMRDIRRENFVALHEKLRTTNELTVALDDGVPLCYPYLVTYGAILKKRLIANKVFTPTFWPHLASSTRTMSRLISDLVCIPCDQRYDVQDMVNVIDFIQRGC